MSRNFAGFCAGCFFSLALAFAMEAARAGVLL